MDSWEQLFDLGFCVDLSNKNCTSQDLTSFVSYGWMVP